MGTGGEKKTTTRSIASNNEDEEEEEEPTSRISMAPRMYMAPAKVVPR